MDEAGYNWNVWSAAGKANKPIHKTLNSIHLEDEPFDEERPEEDVVLDRELEWLDQLPEVLAITGVLLRQQTRRRCIPSTLRSILSFFPRLEEVFYKP